MYVQFEQFEYHMSHQSPFNNRRVLSILTPLIYTDTNIHVQKQKTKHS